VHTRAAALATLLCPPQEQGRHSPLQQLQLLLTSLRHHSIAVRHVALGEVRRFLLQHKGFMGDTMAGLLSCSSRPALRSSSGAAASVAAAAAAAAVAGSSEGTGSRAGSGEVKLQPVQCQELLSELMAALLASCENLGCDGLAASMKQRCVCCLLTMAACSCSSGAFLPPLPQRRASTKPCWCAVRAAPPPPTRPQTHTQVCAVPGPAGRVGPFARAARAAAPRRVCL
jgi:hypothetical protein